MNYILITISSIVNRTKEVAVHKSYGASETNIHSMVLSETLVHMVCSIMVSIFLIFLCRDIIYDLLDVSVETLLLSKGALVLLGVCVIVFLVTGLVPGCLFARIPVAAAFRNFRESRRVWKLCLLFLQFIAAGLLVTLLLIVGRQHAYMVNSDPGYSYDRLAYCSISAIDSTTRYKVLDEVMRLPEVEAVSTSYSLPFGSMSGNNIALPESEKELFNIADQYWVSNGFLDLMEIPVIEGRSFTENIPVSDEVMVNRAFVEKMKEFVDWPDGAVGKSIYISEHDRYGSKYYTICGVYENYIMGSLIDMDARPSVLFYRQRPSAHLLVKFHRMTPDAVGKVNEIERTDAGPRAETDGLFRSDGRPVQQFPEVPRRSDDRGINNADNLPDRIDRLYERRSEPTPQGIGHPQSERGYDEGYSTDILERRPSYRPPCDFIRMQHILFCRGTLAAAVCGKDTS